MENFKKHICNWAVFIINILLLLLGYQAIKSSDKNAVVIKESSQTEVKPLSQKIIDVQNNITADRENKLRGINSSPKQIKQNQTTQTTVITPAPAPAKSSTTTKTS